MGYVQTAFAASQVLGIPVGLYLSNAWDWHAPFLMIVSVSLVVGALILVGLRPIDSHLAIRHRRSPLAHLRTTVTTPHYLKAFLTTILLSTGSFMILPFSSAFTVHNMGIDIADLPLVYLVAGLCSLVMGPLAGRAADSFGKYKTFVFGSFVDIVLLLLYTHLGKTPLLLVILVTVVMFVGVSSRTVSAQALISAIPSADSRGAFMSINSSVRQISGGLASVLAGLIVVEADNGALLHFDLLGVVVACTFFFSVLMMGRIRRFAPERSRPAQEFPVVFARAALLNKGDG
jgi:predicted MFS family arabinose efflux permease